MSRVVIQALVHLADAILPVDGRVLMFKSDRIGVLLLNLKVLGLRIH